MSGRHRFEVVARGGARGLARVLDVLALLDLTPDDLQSLRQGDDVIIQISFESEPRLAQLCRARLRELVVVRAFRDPDEPPSA